MNIYRKHTKRWLAMILASVMILQPTVTAFAETETAGEAVENSVLSEEKAVIENTEASDGETEKEEIPEAGETDAAKEAAKEEVSADGEGREETAEEADSGDALSEGALPEEKPAALAGDPPDPGTGGGAGGGGGGREEQIAGSNFYLSECVVIDKAENAIVYPGESYSFSVYTTDSYPEENGYAIDFQLYGEYGGSICEPVMDSLNAWTVEVGKDTEQLGIRVRVDYNKVGETYNDNATGVFWFNVRKPFSLEGTLPKTEGTTTTLSIVNPEDLTIDDVSWEAVSSDYFSISPVDGYPVCEVTAMQDITEINDSNTVKAEVYYSEEDGASTMASHTCYLKVTENPTTYYTVQYITDEGEGYVEPQTVSGGTTVRVRDFAFTSDSKTMVGWQAYAVGEDGTEKEEDIYRDGTDLTVRSNYVMKAVWVQNSGINFVLSEDNRWQISSAFGEVYKNEWVKDNSHQLYFADSEGYVAQNRVVRSESGVYCTDATGRQVRGADGIGYDPVTKKLGKMKLKANGTAVIGSGQETDPIGADGFYKADRVLTLHIDSTTMTVALEAEENLSGYSVLTPKKEGYRFCGWYSEGETAGPYFDLTGCTESELYAHWREAGEKTNWTLIHKLENLDDTFTEISMTMEGYAGQTTAWKDVNYSGYTRQPFEGNRPTISADGTTEIEIVYTRNTYSISFDMTDTEIPTPEPITAKFGEIIDLPDLNGYAAEGTMALGWYADLQRFAENTMPASDLVLKPVFAKGEDWVYDGNGWKYGKGEAPTNEWVEIEGISYYFGEDGHVARGLQEIYERDTDEWCTYYFDASGKMAKSVWVIRPADFKTMLLTGELQARYHIGSDGKADKGFREINGKRYCFDESGKALTGFAVEDGGYLYPLGRDEDVLTAKYYFNPYGEQQFGTVAPALNTTGLEQYEDFDKLLFFFGSRDSDGAKLTDTELDLDNVTYHIDLNGVMLPPATYTVEVYVENAAGELIKESTEVINGYAGEMAQIPQEPASRTGYLPPTAPVPAYIRADSSTVFRYELFREQVRLELFGDEGIASVEAVDPSESGMYRFGQTVTVKAVAKSGYAFTGWKTGETKVGSTAEYTFEMPLADFEQKQGDDETAVRAYALKAESKTAAYTVIFHGNGASGSMSGQTFGLVEKKKLTQVGFTKTGFHFDGWAASEGGSKVYDDQAEVEKLASADGAEVHLYARWAVNTYTVKFDANGGTGTMSGQTFSYGEKKALTGKGFAKTGHSFGGWALAAEGDAVYSDRQQVENLKTEDGADITLYAVWTANTYKVAYSANGGTGSAASQDFTYGTAQALAAGTGFTKTGYHIDGWAAATDGEKVYSAGQSVSNLTEENGATVILYAHWAPNTDTVYKVRHYKQTLDGRLELEDEKEYTGTTGTKVGPGEAEKYGEGFRVLENDLSKKLTIAADGSTVFEVRYYRETTELQLEKDEGINTVTGTGTYMYGESVTVTAYPKEGYHFVKWTKGENVFSEDASQTFEMKLGDMVEGQTVRLLKLKAVSAPNSYKVSFDANGGTGSISSQNFTYTAAQNLTANSFAKTGYTFAGWALAADGTKKYDNQESVSDLTAENNGEVVLYALWTPNSYTVKYHTNNGSGIMADQTLTYDEEKALATVGFTRTGYTFGGWAETAEGTVKYQNRAKVKNLKTGTAGDDTVDLYATWQANTDTVYTVEHLKQKADDPTQYEKAAAETRTGTTGKQTAAAAKNYSGFTAQSFSQTAIMPDGKTVVTIKYDRKEYQVAFSTDKGVAPGSKNVKYGTAVTEPDAPEAENFEFAGWYTDEKRTDRWSFSNTVAKNMMLYAKWNAKKKKVDLDPQDGTVSPAEVQVLYGETYTGLPVPTKTGYGFTGWFTEAAAGTRVDNTTAVTDTADEVLFAHWQANSYTVAFNAGTGKFESGSDTRTVAYGDAYGILPVVSKEGYTFEGWYTQAAGGARITAETEAAITDTQILYAQYKAIPYSINYSGLDGAVSDNPDTYTIEDKVELKAPTKEGWVFAGWNATGSGLSATGEIHVVIEKGTTGTVAVTANWTKVEAKQNQVIESSQAKEKALSNESAKQLMDELKDNSNAQSAAENLGKALDPASIKEMMSLEGGIEDAGQIEVSLEVRLSDIDSVKGREKEAVLTFEISPVISLKDAGGTEKATVPLGDDALNGERISFRLGVPDSITSRYVKINHLGNVSYHEVKTDGSNKKYVEMSVTSFSPFEMSFSDVAYTVDGIAEQTYTGSASEPAVTVRYAVSGTEVDPSEYTVRYENNTGVTSAAKAIITILASGMRLEKGFAIAEKSSSNGTVSDFGGSSGSSSSSGSGSGGPGAAIPAWVEKDGTWAVDAKGVWTYTRNGSVYKNRWGCIYNPYANTRAGQKAYDWFYFGADGQMLTGWFTDTDGNIYYLNPVSDGTKGCMAVGWKEIDGKWYFFSTAEGSGTMGALLKKTTTPDGYKVDKNGVWIK